MKIHLDLSKADVDFFKTWASISRTMTAAIDSLDLFADAPATPTAHDKADLAQIELQELCGPLDRLHSLVRNQIWATERLGLAVGLPVRYSNQQKYGIITSVSESDIAVTTEKGPEIWHRSNTVALIGKGD